MTLTLQITFLVVSILMFLFVILKVRKSQLQIADGIAWILGSILLVVISLFSDVIVYASNLLGFYSVSNFVLTLFVFFLLVIAFLQNIKISMLSEKLKNLNHYIALTEQKKDCKKQDHVKD